MGHAVSRSLEAEFFCATLNVVLPLTETETPQRVAAEVFSKLDFSPDDKHSHRE